MAKLSGESNIVVTLRLTKKEYDFFLKQDPMVAIVREIKPSPGRAFATILSKIGFNHMEDEVKSELKKRKKLIKSL